MIVGHNVRIISYSFWPAVAAFIGVSFAIALLGTNLMVSYPLQAGLVTMAGMLAICTVYGIRRLHDMGLSGCWAVLCMVPPLSILAMLAMVLITFVMAIGPIATASSSTFCCPECSRSMADMPAGDHYNCPLSLMSR